MPFWRANAIGRTGSKRGRKPKNRVTLALRLAGKCRNVPLTHTVMAVLPCINAPLTLTAFSLSRGEGETTMFLPVWQQILHSARMRFVVPGFLVWALPLLSAGPARA